MSDRAVRYVFSATGQGSVLSAFRSIDSAYQQHARTLSRTGTSAGRVQTQEARAVNQTARLAEKVARDQERAQTRVVRAAERNQARVAAAAERAAKAETRAHERKHAEQTRAAERAAKAQARAKQTNEKQRRREWERNWAGPARDMAWGAGRAVLGAAKGAALAGLGVGGLALRESFQTDDIARQIAVSSRGQGEDVNVDAIRKNLQGVAIATPGISAQEVGGGLQQFISKTGRRDIGEAMLPDFATVASATGAKMDEVASAAAAMFEKFDIKSIDDMRQAFATLTFQGKQGSFELKDAASQYDKLTAAAGRLGIGKGAKAVATLGGLTQISRSATGSSEQAATALEATFRQLTAKSGVLRQQGVRVFDDAGQARDIQDVLVETIAKVGGKDIEKKKVGLQEIFGEEGIRAITPLITDFADATAKGKDGVQAMRDHLAKAIQTTAKWSDVQEDASIQQKSAGNTLTGVWERLKAAVGDALIPKLTAWGEKIAAWAEGGGFEQFAEGLATAADILGKLGEAALSAAEFLGLVDKKDTGSPFERMQKYQKELAGFSDKEKDRYSVVRNVGEAQAIEQLGIAGDDKAIARFRRYRAASEGFDAAQKANEALSGPISNEDFVKQLTALTGGDISKLGGPKNVWQAMDWQNKAGLITGPEDIGRLINAEPSAVESLAIGASDPVRQLLNQRSTSAALESGAGGHIRGGEEFQSKVQGAGDRFLSTIAKAGAEFAAKAAEQKRADIGVGG